MPPKRQRPSSGASSSGSKRTATSKGKTVVRPSPGAPVNDVVYSRIATVLKIPNRRPGGVGYTIMAVPGTKIGDSGFIDGKHYIIRSETQLRDLVRDRKWKDVETTCTSYVTNMESLFFQTEFNGSIGHWDTSRVTTMALMFKRAHKFNQRIGGWDTSQVTDMSQMFGGAISFNRPLDAWDTSKVKTMQAMFMGAVSFNSALGSWDVSRVNVMDLMFKHATIFNQKIGGWDVSSVIQMRSMFDGATAFNRTIGDWDVGRVVYMDRMFLFARSFNQSIGGWDTRSVRRMDEMFMGATAFNMPIGDWDTGRVVDMSNMFFSSTSFNQEIGGWTVSNVVKMDRMFCHAAAFNKPLSGWNMGSVRGMFEMLKGAKSFRQDLRGWLQRPPSIGWERIKIDDETLRHISDSDPVVVAFKRRQYRLHEEVDGQNTLMMTGKIPLDSARVIAGDVDTRGFIRHIWSAEAMDGMVRSGRTLEQPYTKRRFHRCHILPLRDVLHPSDIRVYKKLRGGKTMGQMRRPVR